MDVVKGNRSSEHVARYIAQDAPSILKDGRPNLLDSSLIYKDLRPIAFASVGRQTSGVSPYDGNVLWRARIFGSTAAATGASQSLAVEFRNGASQTLDSILEDALPSSSYIRVPLPIAEAELSGEKLEKKWLWAFANDFKASVCGTL